jgi:hypothetical protein
MRMRLLVAWRLGALCLLAGLCVIPHVALAQSRVAFAHERDVATQVGESVPAWSGGALVGVDFNRSKTPIVYAADREGRREEIGVDLPGAMTVFVRGAVSGSDGVMAVIGYEENADRAGHFLVLISPDRQRRTVIQISPYVAQLVTIAGDGTIWTVGGLRSDVRDETKVNILKRYDTSGKELSSLHVRARARAGIWPDAVSSSYLVASRDRVGWFTNGCEYIEFSLDGREIERFDGPPGVGIKQVSGVGLDAENGFFVGRKGDHTFEVLALDRISRGWNVSVRGTTGLTGAAAGIIGSGLPKRRV